MTQSLDQALDSREELLQGLGARVVRSRGDMDLSKAYLSIDAGSSHALLEFPNDSIRQAIRHELTGDLIFDTGMSVQANDVDGRLPPYWLR